MLSSASKVDAGRFMNLARQSEEKSAMPYDVHRVHLEVRQPTTTGGEQPHL